MELQETLRKEKLRVEKDVAVAGLVVPFAARTARGGLILIDPRLWPPTEESWERAKRLSALYRRRTGASAALIVIPELAVTDPENGVVNEAELIHILRAQAAARESLSLRRPAKSAPLPPASSMPRIFAAMPFSPEYDDVFVVAIAGAADKAGAIAERIDHVSFTGDIVAEIRQRIDASAVLVADLSELRPNVLYETGYADGRAIPTVRISSSPLKDLPFDLRNDRTIAYQKGQTAKLVAILARELKAALSETPPARKRSGSAGSSPHGKRSVPPRSSPKDSRSR